MQEPSPHNKWQVFLLAMRRQLLCSEDYDHIQSKTPDTFTQFTYLVLSLNVRVLVEAGCRNLSTVSLEGLRLDDSSAYEISRAGWAQLRSLNLGTNMIMAKGVRYLALAKWGNLESLSLNGNFFKDEGIQYLSTGKWPRLQRLKLDQNQLSKYSANYLEINSQWPEMTEIYLSGNRFGLKGIELLCDINWSNLVQINLDKCQLADESFRLMCSRGNWPLLKNLSLKANQLTDRAMKFIPQGYWPKLQKIFLTDNKITDVGVEQLHKCSWGELKELDTKQNKICGKSQRNLISLVAADWKEPRLISLLDSFYIGSLVLGLWMERYPAVTF